MWLIVGLGNPGAKYAFTRHNIGFLAIDIFAQGFENLSWEEDHKAHLCKFKFADTQVILAKPLTFMNKSGEAVLAIMNFYKIAKENLLVIHDDVDQPFGQIRFQKNRGHGGNNGVRNISEVLGTQDYIRMKLGVGRPPHPEMQVGDYVLTKFSTEEQTRLTDILNKAGDGIESLLQSGFDKTASIFNANP